jgi:hypothetical protein
MASFGYKINILKRRRKKNVENCARVHSLIIRTRRKKKNLKENKRKRNGCY